MEDRRAFGDSLDDVIDAGISLEQKKVCSLFDVSSCKLIYVMHHICGPTSSRAKKLRNEDINKSLFAYKEAVWPSALRRWSYYSEVSSF